ncbi:MAG TPA: NADH-quinone oxidoreductase subunit C [bacterium]|nr:NADH-quinone oxidoreductase subunit C [bacterium]
MTDAEAGLRQLVPEAEVQERSPRRFYIRIPRERLTVAAQFLHRERGMRLATCTGIDTREGFEVLYHFCEDGTGTIYTLKVLASKDDPRIESQSPWSPAADWIEREMHELLGIDFPGHPNLTRLLTSDTDWDADMYPLRRDFVRSRGGEAKTRREAHEQ